MSETRVTTYSEEVRILIEERLRIKGRTLEKALGKAGRLLPKWAQREGSYLVHAEHYMDHPKLRLMIDPAKVEKAHHALVTHLRTIDPNDRRKGRILSLLGAVSFNLIAVAAGLVVYLWWNGFV